MMPDETLTPTIFRRYRDGEVVALFPTIPADDRGHCSSYIHLGQHGAANPAHVIAHTRPALPDEYAELLTELTGIGYEVRPVQRMTRRMIEERHLTLTRWLA